jgi:glycosyltransferase involved in cell wall biosynthesis
MKNKKIFFLADAKSIHTVKWINYFVEKNYDVYLATFASINNTKCKNIYFLGNRESKTGGGNYHYLFGITKLARIFENIQPDVINAHYSYSMGLIALMAKYKSKVKSKFSIVCHGSDVLAPPIPFIVNKINKYLFNRCDKIFVVSDQIKDKVESFGIDEDKIFIGQYGVDIEIENNIIKDIDILSNRAYNTNSRIDFLLDCVDSLNRKDLNIVFVLPNISDFDFDKISRQYSYIKFYKYVEYDKMIDMVKRAKIFISATKSDGTSLSLLEAMKYKCILLVSNIVSNRSWVLDGVNGYLFNSKKDFIEKLNNGLDLRCELKNSFDNNNLILLKDKADYKNQMKKIETFLMDDI